MLYAITCLETKFQTIHNIVIFNVPCVSNFSMEGGFYAKYKSAPPQNSLVLGAGVKPYLGFHYAKEGYIQPVLADVARAVASKIKSALP